MINKKLIDIHFEWMEKRKIYACGLCNSVPRGRYADLLELFEPTEKDYKKLQSDHAPSTYWGKENFGQYSDDYTNRRQTIVLFICYILKEY